MQARYCEKPCRKLERDLIFACWPQ